MKVVGIVPLGGAGEVVEVDETKIGKVDGATRCALCGRLRVGKSFLHVCSIGRCSHVFGL